MDSDTSDPRPRRITTYLIIAALLLACGGFVALGTWQVHRLAWKRDLIARVDARVAAEAVAPPAPERWAAVTAADDEYRHVRLSGTYLANADTRVDALTELGAGDWILSPLQTDQGVVMINRGFVPKRTDYASVPGALVTVEGLLRITEPKGRVLADNEPEQDRWYSRDVAAIAAKRGLAAQAVAPYFVDAAYVPEAPEYPRGGMTVVRFHNSHLAYLLTWYTLALMSLGAIWKIWRESRR